MPTKKPSSAPVYHVLEINSAEHGRKLTGVMAPGEKHDIIDHKFVVGKEILMSRSNRQNIPPETVAEILEMTERLKALVAKTMEVPTRGLSIEIPADTGRLKQTVLQATYDPYVGSGYDDCCD